MKTLFSKKKPKVVKVTPGAKTRQLASIDFSHKSDFQKFSSWLDFSANDLGKIGLPRKSEIKKLQKDLDSDSGTGSGGLLGLLSGLAPLLPALGVTALVGGTAAATSILTGQGGLVTGALAGLKNIRTPKKPPTVKPYKPSTSGVRPRPGTGGRPKVTTTGGRGIRRPNIRNPFRNKPGVTTSGGGRTGRPDIRNPFRNKPNVTTGSGGQKFKSIKNFLSKLAPKQLKKLAFNLGKKFVVPLIKKGAKRIPIIGPLIDFALNVFVFKENIGRAAFKAIGAGFGAWILGTLGSVIPGFGTFLGGIVGGVAGDWLGGKLYDAMYGSSVGQKQLKEKNEFSSSGESEGEEIEVSTGANIKSVSHKETGSGFNPAGAKDNYGRPVVLSKEAAIAFAKMIKDSNGVVTGTDVWSSQRSPEKNREVGGVPNSNHLYGNSLDIHRRSQAWMKQHGAKYGWFLNDYAGGHGGHFNFRPVPEQEGTGDPPQATPTPISKPRMMSRDSKPDISKSFLPLPKMEVAATKPKVAQFTLAAEAANSDNVIVISQPSLPQQQQQSTPQIVPVPMGGASVGGQGNGPSRSQIMSNVYESLLATKLDV